VIGVILTGTLDDGTAGIAAVKGAGGTTIAQDPDEALAPGMPRNAINTGTVDHVLPLADIPVLLSALVEEDAPIRRPPVDHPYLHPLEPDLGRMPLATRAEDRPGRPSRSATAPCGSTMPRASCGSAAASATSTHRRA
jgi:two-component system chemotaxis response regulator CheB